MTIRLARDREQTLWHFGGHLSVSAALKRQWNVVGVGRTRAGVGGSRDAPNGAGPSQIKARCLGKSFSKIPTKQRQIE